MSAVVEIIQLIPKEVKMKLPQLYLTVFILLFFTSCTSWKAVGYRTVISDKDNQNVVEKYGRIR